MVQINPPIPNSLRPIVIGSLWRRCAARLGVAEVRSNVATFFMSQYTNFIQFGGESDGIHSMLTSHSAFSGSMGSTFRRESVIQLVIQLDIVNVYPSADRQAQFNVLAGRA